MSVEAVKMYDNSMKLLKETAAAGSDSTKLHQTNSNVC